MATIDTSPRHLAAARAFAALPQRFRGPWRAHWLRLRLGPARDAIGVTGAAYVAAWHVLDALLADGASSLREADRLRDGMDGAVREASERVAALCAQLRDGRACRDCGTPDDALTDGRCRDCDLARSIGQSTCRACLRWIMRPAIAGPTEDQHRARCTLRVDPDPYPQDEAELREVLRRRDLPDEELACAAT